MDDTRAVLQGFRTRTAEHVKGAANATAHGLAKATIINTMDKILMEEILSSILILYVSDTEEDISFQ